MRKIICCLLTVFIVISMFGGICVNADVLDDTASQTQQDLILDLDFSTYTGTKTITDKTGNVNSEAFLIAGTQPNLDTFQFTSETDEIKYLKFSNGGIRMMFNDDYMSADYPLRDMNNAVSFETWVYTTDGTGTLASHETLFALRTGNASSNAVVKRAVYDGSMLSAMNASDYHCSTSIADKTGDKAWHHVVVTFTAPDNNKSTVTTYMDGVRIAEPEEFAVATGTPFMLGLGCLNTSGGRSLKGGMATFKVYNKVLETSEIEQIYKAEAENYMVVSEDEEPPTGGEEPPTGGEEPPTGEDEPQPDDLVLDLDFSTYTGTKSITDKTGNVNNGAFLIAGTQPIKETFQLTNETEAIDYLKFSDGGIRMMFSDDYMSADYPLRDMGNAVSFETWVYTTNGSGTLSSHETLFALRTSDTVVKRAVYDGSKLSAMNASDYYCTTSIAGKTGDKAWHHIVVTFTAPNSEKSTVTVYMDGVQAAEPEEFDIITGTPYMLGLGCLNTSGGRPLKGGMATFKAYNRVLGASEIKQLYKAEADNYISKTLEPEQINDLVLDLDFSTYAGAKSITDKTGNVDSKAFLIAGNLPTLEEFQSADGGESVKYLKFENGGIRMMFNDTDTGYPLRYTSNPVSFETWIYTTSGAGTLTEHETLFSLRTGTASSNSVVKRAVFDASMLSVMNAGDTYCSADIKETVGEYAWHHVVVTFAAPVDGKSMVTVYMDGVNVGTTDEFAVTEGTPYMLGLGCLNDKGERSLQGGMASFKAYNKVLDASEVKKKFLQDCTSYYALSEIKPDFYSVNSDVLRGADILEFNFVGSEFSASDVINAPIIITDALENQIKFKAEVSGAGFVIEPYKYFKYGDILKIYSKKTETYETVKVEASGLSASAKMFSGEEEVMSPMGYDELTVKLTIKNKAYSDKKCKYVIVFRNENNEAVKTFSSELLADARYDTEIEVSAEELIDAENMSFYIWEIDTGYMIPISDI